VRARLAAKQWKKCLHAVNDAPVVDAHQPGNLVEGELLDRAMHRDAGIVDKQRDASMLLDHLSGKLFDAFQVRDVYCVCRDLLAAGGEL
jgi:hypothetical protein